MCIGCSTETRAADWGVDYLYPLSCVNCNNDDFVGGGAIGFIDWYLEKDPTVRMAHYSALWDVNQRFFAGLLDTNDDTGTVGAPAFHALFYLRRSVF